MQRMFRECRLYCQIIGQKQAQKMKQSTQLKQLKQLNIQTAWWIK
ncbi:unnamed protein product [Paramecium octaurelia]|uniref:Uncharacterized protein n=1 Tax=Paramecium octaurelia TaxID=43137 RepID=A0A8S1TZ09_PAROT|nr:unnamed protein product [Paramecium octaurelia]